MKRLAPVVLVTLALVFIGSLPSPLSAADHEIQDVMNGAVSGLNVTVNGSGGGYYGQSLQATFNNTTGETLTIKVPIGLAMVPQNVGTQTMFTAGAEIITVPPGASQSLIIAFCGEKHDSGPRRSDIFTPGGFATGSLLQTLQNINRSGSFGNDAQQAVWHHTDGIDISNNETATDLVSGFGALGTTAVAGLVAAVVAGGGALLLNRVERDGDSPLAEDGEPLIADAGDSIGDIDIAGYRQDLLPPELRPPIEIAEIPSPEDPADRIMIASSDETGLEMLWNAFLEGRRMNPQAPAERPPIFGHPASEDENWTEWWDRTKREYGWGQRQSPEERERQHAEWEHAGDVIKENPPLGSGGKLGPALTDNDPSEFVKQVNREKYEEGAVEGIRIIRRLMNLTSLTNAKGDVRDISGGANILRDYVEPDAGGAIEASCVYQKDDAAHQAWREYYENHGKIPNPDNPGEVQEFMSIYHRMKGK
ncbi:hypothetical protein ABFB09_02100 [Dehalogenimonas sp. THU2]|uniref:hypothetical protein n=1 Tax=Dehalogenimonas sp. THU2 TaxID=3151121 RepID=UPI00321836DB